MAVSSARGSWITATLGIIGTLTKIDAARRSSKEDQAWDKFNRTVDVLQTALARDRMDKEAGFQLRNATTRQYEINANLYRQTSQTHPTPVSYTHLTLPTICSV